MLPISSAFVLLLSSMPSNIEIETQRQIEILAKEIISSLTDCEMCMFLNSTHFLIHWLYVNKSKQFEYRINNAITSEMIQFLGNKYKLKKFTKEDNIKIIVAFAGVSKELTAKDFFPHRDFPNAMEAAYSYLDEYQRIHSKRTLHGKKKK